MAVLADALRASKGLEAPFDMKHDLGVVAASIEAYYQTNKPFKT